MGQWPRTGARTLPRSTAPGCRRLPPDLLLPQSSHPSFTRDPHTERSLPPRPSLVSVSFPPTVILPIILTFLLLLMWSTAREIAEGDVLIAWLVCPAPFLTRLLPFTRAPRLAMSYNRLL